MNCTRIRTPTSRDSVVEHGLLIGFQRVANYRAPSWPDQIVPEGGKATMDLDAVTDELYALAPSVFTADSETEASLARCSGPGRLTSASPLPGPGVGAWIIRRAAAHPSFLLQDPPPGRPSHRRRSGEAVCAPRPWPGAAALARGLPRLDLADRRRGGRPGGVRLPAVHGPASTTPQASKCTTHRQTPHRALPRWQ